MRHFILLVVIAILLSNCSVPGKEAVQTATYVETEAFSKLGLPFSQAVIYGDIIYVSGQIGDVNETLVTGGITAETRQTMLNIKQILEANGSSLDQIIKCTCMLADIADWADMSQEYMTFFPNHKPARSAFATTGLALGARVEIECMAYLNK